MAATISYPGVSYPRSVRYTLTRGVLPDIAYIEMVSQSTTIAANGDLTFGDGTTSVTLPDCRVNKSSLRVSSGGQLMHVELWDRRYWWKYRRITGRYNFMKADGTLDTSGQKTMRELATLCLTAAGETGYSVSALPATEYPYVSWDNDRPMDELQKLCQRYGYEIVWSPYTNTVTIVQENTGTSLPNNTDVKSFSFGVTAGERPSSIVLVGSKISYQSKLKLVAVGLDTDGSIKKIDSLSYKPAVGWSWIHGTEWDDIGELHGAEAQRLAQQTVYRWYQVESQADGTQNVPGFGAVSSIDKILPLDEHSNDTFTSLGGEQRNRRCIVQGIWLPGAGEDLAVDNTSIDEQYEDQFTLVNETGLVIFGGENPVVKKDGAGAIEEAELYLTTSYNVKSATTHQPLRYERTLTLSGAPTLSGPLVIEHPEVVQRFTGVYSGSTLSSTTNNTPAADTMADSILAQTALGLGDNAGYVVSYRLIKQITPNGKIWQVGWFVRIRTGNNSGGCDTVAAQQMEFDPNILGKNDRRRLILARFRDRLVFGPADDRRWFFGKET